LHGQRVKLKLSLPHNQGEQMLTALNFTTTEKFLLADTIELTQLTALQLLEGMRLDFTEEIGEIETYYNMDYVLITIRTQSQDIKRLYNFYKPCMVNPQVEVRITELDELEININH
jgi:hypothetical protein